MLIAYSLRSIWARRLSTIAPALATAVAIGGASTSAAYLQGFADMLSRTSARVAVVATPAVAGEWNSGLDREQVLRAAVLAKDTGRATPVADLVTVLPCNGRFARFRGVATSSADAHGGVVLPDVLFKEGTRGVLVGAMLAMEDPAMNPPSSLRIGDIALPILGVLEAPGTPYESEIWTAHSTLTDLHLAAGYSTLRLPITDAAHLGSVREAITRMFHGVLEARTERDFFEQILRRADAGSHEALVLATLVLLVVAGLTANFNAMYSVALSRRSEFFTLSILGFRRAQIIGLLLQESILVNLLGGSIGLFAARVLVDRKLVEVGESQILAAAHFSPEVIAAALGLSLVIGVLGGGIAAVQAIASRK